MGRLAKPNSVGAKFEFRSTFIQLLRPCVVSIALLYYTVGHKKRAPKLLSITLAILNRF